MALAAGMAAASGAAAQAAGGASAQPVLQEVVVTAQRRAERLENVPMSVTAVTPETIAKSGVTSIHDISQIVSGAQVNFAGVSTQPAIRGVSTLTTGVGFENNVAIYVDGFYEPDNISINADFANLAGLEVLKGPQGTLWGRNATGGAILMTTKAPSKVLTGDLEAGYGRFNERLVSGYISGPINDRVRYSLAGYFRKSDGYNKQVNSTNTVVLSDKLTPINQASVRAKLEADVTDKLTATLGYNYGLSYDARGEVFQVFEHASALVPVVRSTEPFHVSVNLKPIAGAIMNEGTVKLAYQTPIGTLTSYTGYAHRHTEVQFDFDSSASSIIESASTYAEDTFQETVDYNINAIKNLDLIVGGYYYFDQQKNLGTQSISGNRVSNVSNWREGAKAYAFYADGTYHFTDKLSLNLGARYSQDHKEMVTYATTPDRTRLVAPRFANDADFSAFTPRASLRYEFAPRTNVYASYSKGYRTGGFQPSANTRLVPYEPEKITAYEVGFKTAQSTFRFNAAAFYYDYRNLQVGITVPDPISGVINLTLNAKKAEIYGVDSDIDWEPIEHLHVRAGAAWLHGRYIDFNNATNISLNPTRLTNQSQILFDWGGLQMARAPKFAGNIGADYEVQDVIKGGKLLLAANASYTDPYALSNPSVYGTLPGMAPQYAREERFLGKAHTLLNASATWTDGSGHYKVTVWGNNLSDVRYRITYNGNTATGDYNSWSEPRTYGVRVGYMF